MTKIAFVLPVPNNKIIGGYKVVYEYANYLAKKGLNITILYNAHKGENSKGLPKFIAFCIRFCIGKFGPKWFHVDSKIKKKVLYSYNNQKISSYDVLIATAAETAKYVNQSKADKFYFIQGFDNSIMNDSKVYETYKYEMNCIVVSKWLKQCVEKKSPNKIIYIPNGINKNIFKEKIPYETRKNHSVSMLYHDDPNKGSKLGLEVLYKLKKIYPDLEANLFGSPSRPKQFPKWIHYVKNATPEEVSECMNKSRVFLCTSQKEGFGLTGLEAMFCGCILVTTDCLGIREYANDKNAYICEINNKEQILKAMVRSFDDRQNNMKLKYNYTNVISFFDEDISKEKFYRLLKPYNTSKGGIRV